MKLQFKKHLKLKIFEIIEKIKMTLLTTWSNELVMVNVKVVM